MSFPSAWAERPWKYVDISDLDVSAYQPGAGAQHPEQIAALRERLGISSGSLLVQENGGTIATETTENVTLTDFSAADAKTAALIDEKLSSAVPVERSRFTALHYAYQRGGVLVEVGANVEVAEPVRIVRDLTAAQLAAPHTLIITGANSQVEVIEDYRSSDEAILVIPAIEILLGEGSRLRYTALHRWGKHTKVFSEQRTIAQRDATLTGTSVVTSGQLIKGHIESSLVGRGALSELFGVFLGDGDTQVDYYTLQDHIGPDTRSDLLFKSALKGRSRSAYYGLTRVGLGARNSDANQEDRNLLLSREARADSDPVLEILTSEVIRCTHGATTGPVDDEQLFYLESRGIPKVEAEALLVRAFLTQVLTRISNETFRQELEGILDARLEGRA